MAITASNLTNSSTTTDANSYDIASITPSANKLILVSVLSRASSGTTNVPTLSGNGLTYVEVVNYVTSENANRVTIFRAMGASPTTGAITIDFDGQTQIYCHWSVNEFTGIDTSGTNGSGAIVQSAGNTNSSTNTGLTVTLSAFESSNNAAYGSVRAGNAVTPGSGFTELSQTTVDTRFQTQWKDSQDTTVDWTWSSSPAYAVGCAVEIKAPYTLTTDLVSYYTMDDLTTSTIEDVHGSNNGTKKAANEPIEADGKIGKAQDFSSNDYITLGNTLGNGDLLTINFWAIFPTGDTTFRYVIGKGNTNKWQWDIDWRNSNHATNPGKITLVQRNQSGSSAIRTIYSSRAISNETVMITAVLRKDATASKLYLNGSVDGTSDSTGTDINTSDDQNFFLGTRNTSGTSFGGIIDEVGVWSRELTADEITALYNGGNGRTYPLALTNFHNLRRKLLMRI